MSDGWAAYAHIDQIQGQDYSHSVIIHDQNFVDLNDPEIHTVLRVWSRVKRQFRHQYGTNDRQFTSYLHEWMSRNRYRVVKRNFFSGFLSSLPDVYPV